jgi:hypothetical protein
MTHRDRPKRYDLSPGNDFACLVVMPDATRAGLCGYRETSDAIYDTTSRDIMDAAEEMWWLFWSDVRDHGGERVEEIQPKKIIRVKVNDIVFSGVVGHHESVVTFIFQLAKHQGMHGDQTKQIQIPERNLDCIGVYVLGMHHE